LTQPAGPSVFKHPGLYLAIAGVAASAIGVYFGAQAKAVERRALDADGDGRLDITRTDALTAQRHALLSNALVGSGIGAALLGTTWVLVLPVRTANVTAGLAVGGTF
jgi:hypothetical protein